MSKRLDRLSIGSTMHFPVHEGATIVNADVHKGLHSGNYAQDVSVLSLHNKIKRDGVLQNTTPANNAIVAGFSEAGVPFTALNRQDFNDGIANGPEQPYSEQDLETLKKFTNKRHVLTTLEEHPLDMLSYLDSQDLPPIVANLYRSGEFKPTFALNALNKALAERSIATLTVDGFASRDTYVNLGVPAGIIEVIPNGVDINRFKPSQENRAEIRAELKIGETDPTVLLVARDSEEKDIPLFLKSARIYLTNLVEGHVIMAGSGLNLTSLHVQQMVSEHFGDEQTLKARLHIVGARPDFQKMYNASDILALTSITESSPLCIPESQASGVMVAVSTDVGDAARLIGRHGIITGRDPSEIANAWQEAFAKRNEIGYDITKRNQLGTRPMIAHYANVIRAAAS